MAKKRQLKKNLKKRQENALQRKGYSKKEIKRVTPKERERALKQEEAEKKRAKVRQQKAAFIRKNNLESVSLISRWTKRQVLKNPTVNSSWEDLEKALRKKKKDEREQRYIQQLLSAGYDLDQITAKMVSSQKAVDKAILQRQKSKYDVDWNKVYHTDKAIYIGFRDLTQELNLGGIIKDFLNLPIEDVLKELWRLVELPLSYTGTVGTSSGSPGQARVWFGDEKDVERRKAYEDMSALVRHKDRIRRLKKKRKYTSSNHQEYIKYQTLNNGYIHDFSLKNLLATGIALLANVFEQQRKSVYEGIWYIIEEVEPKALKYLPPVK